MNPCVFSRPQAQLSRSTFALHYVWILECPVTENREICDVDGHIWRFKQRPQVCPVGSWGCRSYPGKVFGEISDVLPSDAHQIARYRASTWQNRRSRPKLIKILISSKILIFPSFFVVLSALNHCKRSQRRLHFVWDVLRAF